MKLKQNKVTPEGVKHGISMQENGMKNGTAVIEHDIEDSVGEERDPLTEIIGKHGRFQFTWCVLGGITVIFHAMMMMSNKWVTHKVDHWCTRPASLQNMDVNEWLNISAPYLENGKLDRCYIFDIDYDNIQERPSNDTPTIPCTSWEYDTSMFQVSFFNAWKYNDIWVLNVHNSLRK